MTERKAVPNPSSLNNADDSQVVAPIPASRAPVPRSARTAADAHGLKAVLYYRVSTNKQDEKNQIPDLRRYAVDFRKWVIVKEYIDHGISGGKDSRPDLDVMMKEIRAGRYDVLLVYSYDRFARSLPHLVLTMDELGKIGVHFASYQEQIDTTTPQGRLMFAIYAGLAEWMRHQIGQKTRATLQRKKDEGMKLGRPEIPPDVKTRIIELRDQGMSYSQIANQIKWVRASGKYGDRKEMNLSKSVVGKILKEIRPQKVRSNVA